MSEQLENELIIRHCKAKNCKNTDRIKAVFSHKGWIYRAIAEAMLPDEKNVKIK